MRFPRMIALSLLGAVAACATPPQMHDVERSRTYNADFETTWRHAVQYFSSNGIQIKTIEKASGIIYAEQALVGNDLGTYADCGRPGMAIVRGTMATFNVFIAENDGKTTVTVNTKYVQTRQFDRNIWTVECTSAGGLERQVLSGLSLS